MMTMTASSTPVMMKTLLSAPRVAGMARKRSSTWCRGENGGCGEGEVETEKAHPWYHIRMKMAPTVCSTTCADTHPHPHCVGQVYASVQGYVMLTLVNSTSLGPKDVSVYQEI